MGNLFDWESFLHELSEELLSDSDIRKWLPAEVVDSGWLGFPGASKLQIEKLETRLGTSLPLSLRSFLLVSNGWRSIGSFIDEICSTETIRWFREENLDWIEAYNDPHMLDRLPEIPDSEYFVYGRDQNPLFRTNYLRTALQVSEIGDSAVCLLCRDGITPSGEWEAWFFANWLPGAVRYGSFQDLMTDSLSRFRELRDAR